MSRTRTSSRLRQLRQQQIEEGTIAPDLGWQSISKDLKPRKWHVAPVKVGHFTVQKWCPVSQKDPTPGLGSALVTANATADSRQNSGLNRGKGRKGFRGARRAATATPRRRATAAISNTPPGPDVKGSTLQQMDEQLSPPAPMLPVKLFPCKYCGKMMQRQALGGHTKVCKLQNANSRIMYPPLPPNAEVAVQQPHAQVPSASYDKTAQPGHINSTAGRDYYSSTAKIMGVSEDDDTESSLV